MAEEAALPDSVGVLDAFLMDMHKLDQQSAGQKSSTHAVVRSPDRPAHRTEAAITARPAKKGSWLKRKQELEKLRQQSEEMETRVIFLKVQQARRGQLGEQGRRWQANARKERARLRTVTRENQALRSRLRHCIHRTELLREAIVAADSLAKARVKANSRAASGEEDTGAQCLSQLIPTSEVFSALKARMASRTLDTPTIIEELQQHAVVLDAVKVKMLGGEADITSVMHYQCTGLLPFDATATFKAAWNIFEEKGIPAKKFSRLVKCSQDTYTIESRFTLLRSSGEAVTADVHCLVKQCTVLEGVVLLAESNTNWSSRREDSLLWTHKTREWAYFAALRQEVGCQVRVVIESHAVEPHTTLHELAMESFQQILSSQRQFVENSLWDNARAATKGLQRGT